MFFFQRHKRGGILTGADIISEVKKGRIKISKNGEPGIYLDRVNPNSYNLEIGDKVTVVTTSNVIDMHDLKSTMETYDVTIGEDGLTLRPGIVYLIPTAEVIGSDYYVPIIIGRSSVGRLGIEMTQDAGFGDIGFTGTWTLQVSVTTPTTIYAHDIMAQMYFLIPSKNCEIKYHGNYQNSKGAVASRYNHKA